MHSATFRPLQSHSGKLRTLRLQGGVVPLPGRSPRRSLTEDIKRVGEPLESAVPKYGHRRWDSGSCRPVGQRGRHASQDVGGMQDAAERTWVGAQGVDGLVTAVGEKWFKRIAQDQSVVAGLVDQHVKRGDRSVDRGKPYIDRPESALRCARGGGCAVAVHDHPYQAVQLSGRRGPHACQDARGLGDRRLGRVDRPRRQREARRTLLS